MKNIKYGLITLSLFATFNIANANEIKQLAPNQYDCTIDELELFVMKRTENLRKESAMATWEDFKKTSTAMKSAPTNTASNGSAQSEVAANNNLQQTGGTSAKEEDDCPLFFEDIPDLPDMSDIDFGGIGDSISGGLSGLQDLAAEQMSQLVDSLTEAIKAGLCERLSTEYLTDLGTDLLDDAMKEEIGYTTRDIEKGNFANKVVNDALQEEYGTSNAKLLNVMDENLNNRRESYFEKQVDGKLDDIEDETFYDK